MRFLVDKLEWDQKEQTVILKNGGTRCMDNVNKTDLESRLLYHGLISHGYNNYDKDENDDDLIVS